MPRIPRYLVVHEGCQAHKMWTSHNREKNLNSFEEKTAYLDRLKRELKKKSQVNKLNCYALMSNHSHEIYDIIDPVLFSNLMRNHHSQYGMDFNRHHNRRGKVAYDRPKTCLIEDDNYSMRATFYIHANPVKAGLTKNAANYIWSTHRLYAFGRGDKYAEIIDFPEWYMRLGDTFPKRQRMYRRLFDAYLREKGLIADNFYEKPFFGNELWMFEGYKKISEWRKKGKSKDPPD